MSANVLSLQRARCRRRVATEERLARRLPPLAIVIQAEQDAVRFLAGDEDDVVELGLTPEQAESIARDLLRAARAARVARKGVERG